MTAEVPIGQARTGPEGEKSTVDLTDVQERLVRDFSDTFPRETVVEVLRESADAFSEARVATFVPILAERSARDRLRKAANGHRRS